MFDHNSYNRSNLLALYFHGKWNIFLESSFAFEADQHDLEVFYLLLRDLTPFRVQDQVLDPELRDCLSPAQLFKLQACRSSLIDVLIALSANQSDKIIGIKLSSFSEFLFDVLNQCSADCHSWVGRLIDAYQPEFLISLRFFAYTHAYSLAGVLPAKLTVVLGMHRSGTSALTGMLHASGLGAPNDALGATESNPFGYWESSCLVELSNRLLHGLGSHWSTMFDLPPRWITSPLVVQWVSDYLHAFSLVFNDMNHLVVKDPRLCILLEPLLPCLQSGLVEVDYVLILRSPIEVMSSLNKSEGICFRDALTLWIVSVLSSEQLTRQCRRTIVTFSKLLENPRDFLTSYYSARGISPVKDNSVFEDSIDCIDVGLRRQFHDDIRSNVLKANPDLSELLIFAERVFSTILAQDCSPDGFKLDQLSREWNRRREIFESSGMIDHEVRK